MIKVRLFGVFRLDTRVKELDMEAGSVKELLKKLPDEIRRVRPGTAISEKALRGCIIAVNSRQVGKNAPLRDGDEVWLVPSVAGG